MIGSQTSFASSTQTSAPLGRRERHRAEIRERLFRAALQVFADKGFAEITCEDITNAADGGKGTFFNYFPTKDHILVAFARMQLRKLQSFIQKTRWTSEPTTQFLAKLGEVAAAEPGRAPEITRMMLLANLSTEPVRAVRRAYQEQGVLLLSQLIEMGQRRSEVRTVTGLRTLPRRSVTCPLKHCCGWSLRPDVPLVHNHNLVQLLQMAS